ncbi:hypothetical protein GDO78_002674 [Eleutherodactylus coqui]|uniref:Uncharacterized protein n=1 Tax=Eleutherodactylus coqui TaxID=57060 RepID=A0A8J6EZE2_ELECQ|nr:hypothetical protein GDO78_002674 [Eleutherodactylus coqui]
MSYKSRTRRSFSLLDAIYDLPFYIPPPHWVSFYGLILLDKFSLFFVVFGYDNNCIQHKGYNKPSSKSTVLAAAFKVLQLA